MKMKRVGALLLAGLMTVTMTACKGLDLNPKESPTSGSEDMEGQTAGYIGDTLSTEWFDFTVQDAYLCDTYADYTPADGNQMLVVSMTLKSTARFSVDMYQNDFPVLWDSEDEDSGYAEAISAISDNQFEDEYTLGINRSESGELVYEVPADVRDFTLAFLEVFDNDETGDTFFVDFTPDAR